ncbi:histidine phosphatase family protein [Domibacillus indicus]|uniref:histidine phosphatase family protein n=1 Tax=Domibacillus indicus TaxID=1437523 RepID=UPI000617C317|nr:histidine phosphatase family protein [Domibacillus indicus]
MGDRVVVGLYRHGLTDANKKRQFCGWTDVPVNEEGLAALKQLTVPDYDWIVSSDLARCRQTASVFWPQTHEVSKKFREFHFGEWEKKTHAELEQQPEYIAWLRDFSLQVPGGDSYAAFAGRAEEGFHDLLNRMTEKGIERAAIVTHGGVIRHLLSIWAPEARPFGSWEAENGQGYELSGSLSAMRRKERCTLLRAVPSTAKENG